MLGRESTIEKLCPRRALEGNTGFPIDYIAKLKYCPMHTLKEVAYECVNKQSQSISAKNLKPARPFCMYVFIIGKPASKILSTRKHTT